MKANKSFVMLTYQFGYNVYIADQQKAKNIITDDIKDAEIWDEDCDISKFEYWKSITGYDLEIIKL